jgi:hypothetical protein
MDSIITLLRRIFGIEDDVDRIVKPITRITDKLAKHAEQQSSAAAFDDENAQYLLSKAEARRAAASRAKSLASRYGELTNF